MSQSMEEGPLREAAILTRAVENVFRKLIRLLIGRITLTKLQEIIRLIFVDEAEQHLLRERSGKSVPLTNLALLTGLETRTLQRLLKERKEKPPLHEVVGFLEKASPESSILDFWSSNSKYINQTTEKPMVLVLRGDSPSFEALVAEVRPPRGVTMNSLLKRLLETDAVKFDKESQEVKLLNPRFMPIKRKAIASALEVGFATISYLVETLQNNIKSKHHESEAMFQRTNFTTRLDRKNTRLLRGEIKEKLCAAEVEVIQILKKYEEKEKFSDQITTGVSMFYFEDQSTV